MEQSTDVEIQESIRLVLSIQEQIRELIDKGKKVHVIWDFDGVLSNSRSDDVFSLCKFDLKTYFTYEEKLLFEAPEEGPWLLPIAHNVANHVRFPPEQFTQDIVTARSSALAFRVQIFCLVWNLPIRWMLFLGHMSKKEAYRIILQSLKNDPDYRVFCVDDGSKHIDAFKAVAIEEGMEERCFPVLSPVIRNYSSDELQITFDRVMNATGNTPIRVRNASDDMDGFIVLPKGMEQFKTQMIALVSQNSNTGHSSELRAAFVKYNGEVGEGRFRTEEELQDAMNQFIRDRVCP